MALPVFLASTQQLLVLAGGTYTSRLWCVMELFVFVRMGGNHGDIDLRLLSDDLEGELAMALGKFDAGTARCFLNRDRQVCSPLRTPPPIKAPPLTPMDPPIRQQKLLAVIEAAFGTLTPFNKLVRSIFAGKLDERRLASVAGAERRTVGAKNTATELFSVTV